MRKLLGLSYVGSCVSFGAATCCVLPMALVLLGLGGSWLAVFSKIAALSYYVLAVSAAVLALAWLTAYRRGSLGRLGWRLAGSTVLSAAAWIVVMNETRINDALIGLM